MAKKHLLRFFRAAGLVVIGLIALTYIAIKAFEVLGDSLCNTTIHRELPSPDNGMLLVIFDRDCGATTGFNTQASFMPHNENFSADTYPSFFAMNGQHDVAARWEGNRQIAIVIPGGDRVNRREPRASGIAIKYSYARP